MTSKTSFKILPFVIHIRPTKTTTPVTIQAVVLMMCSNGWLILVDPVGFEPTCYSPCKGDDHSKAVPGPSYHFIGCALKYRPEPAHSEYDQRAEVIEDAEASLWARRDSNSLWFNVPRLQRGATHTPTSPLTHCYYPSCKRTVLHTTGESSFVSSLQINCQFK